MAPTDPTRIVSHKLLLDTLETSAKTRSAAIKFLKLATYAPPAIAATESPSEQDLAIIRSHKHLSANLSLLRGQNRRLAQLVRATKATTSNSRSEIDTLHLLLQNLYYESRHLLGEIAACESFPHKYMALPMPTEEEFLEQYPDYNGKENAEIMAARIEQEFQDRTALEEQRQGLLAQKTELMKENAKRKEELVKLDSDLERFIDAAKPIQKTFEKEW